MMNSTEGLAEAKRLLEEEYKNDIARSFIDSLIKAPAISTNDHDGIIELAHDMQKCFLTLTQLRYVSDLNSISTLYAIMNRLPDYLQQKWIERAAALNRNNKEPDFKCLLQFIQEQAELLKTSLGKNMHEQRLRRNHIQIKQRPMEKESHIRGPLLHPTLNHRRRLNQ